MGDALGGPGGAAGKEHVGDIVLVARAGPDRRQPGPVDEFHRHDGPAGECPGDIERLLAAQNDDLQGGRQLACDLDELAQLLGVDEQQPRRGVAQEIEQLLRLVEIGYHGRDGAGANRAEPHGDVVEAVGTEQQDAVFRRDADRGQPGRHIGNALGERPIARRLAVHDNGGLVRDRRVQMAVEQQRGGRNLVRHVRIDPRPPVGAIDLLVISGRRTL
jgi:hypothetical protein